MQKGLISVWTWKIKIQDFRLIQSVQALFAVGIIAYSILGYWVRNWRNLSLISSSLGGIFLITFMYVIHDFRIEVERAGLNLRGITVGGFLNPLAGSLLIGNWKRPWNFWTKSQILMGRSFLLGLHCPLVIMSRRRIQWGSNIFSDVLESVWLPSFNYSHGKNDRMLKTSM